MKEIIKKQIEELHGNWQTDKKEKLFRVYMQKHNMRLYEKIIKNSVILKNLPINVQLAWKGKAFKPLGKTILKKYMPQIAERFLEEGDGYTLEGFINNVLRECMTEKELKLFLKKE